MSMTPQVEQITLETSNSKWHTRIPFVGALAIAIMAAMFIVLIAYILYWNDTNRKYDLARPGNMEDNQALKVDDEQADTTSPVDKAAAKQKLEYLQRELKALNELGQFTENELSDEAVQLAPANQPSF